jgi:alkylated DNA repair dioxygenase AlkB
MSGECRVNRSAEHLGVMPAKRASIAQAGWEYVPGYLGGNDADRLLYWLLNEVRWRSEHIQLFGQRRRVPRLVAWFGDAGCSYRYSNTEHSGSGWPWQLEALRDEIGRTVACHQNFVLLNRYRNGSDSMGWHTDDEPMVGQTVASLSFGSTRRFLIRPQVGQPSAKLDLEHGSLLLMNSNLRHCLPKSARPLDERINLSFRSFV